MRKHLREDWEFPLDLCWEYPSLTVVMEQPPAYSLVDRLRSVSHLWVSAQRASLSRLALHVVNDRGFFTRLETQVQGVTTATLEKFAAFLADPANWPEGLVPQEALDLAHVVGVSIPEAHNHAA